jgi:HSP20 family protein
MSIGTPGRSSLFPTLDQLFDDAFFPGPFRTAWSRGGLTGSSVQPMPLDVYATPDQAVILAAVPGMQPDSLEITVHQNTVTLSGTVQDVAQSEEATQATWYLHELWSGKYQRSVTLPFELDASKAQASFASGVVRIVLPKAEQAKPKKIQITAGDAKQAISAGTANGAKA